MAKKIVVLEIETGENTKVANEKLAEYLLTALAIQWETNPIRALAVVAVAGVNGEVLR